MALDHNSAGDRELGWAIRRHQHEEDDDANSLVQRTTTNDDKRRPATRSQGGTVRLNVNGGAPAVFGGCKGTAGVLLLLTNPTVATEGGGDDHSSGAAWLKRRQRRRRLGLRGGGATGNGRARDLGQTEEDD
uniref:OSJNBb0003A12.12 protein n=1 Tax=Oryza sativa subsp. japonica TaxID=39947 RepID=Q7XRH7_ORYSJ|nr:OSJNBb0003A12.12 [Oryza sativa Japonica Group]